MALPGPKPTPTKVSYLYPPSHRTDSETVQLPAEAPAEPDWSQVFPLKMERAAIAKAYTSRERLAMRNADGLDAVTKRCRHVAHKTWTLIVPDLNDRGLLARVDALALTEICIAVARIDQAEREISARGAMLISERGTVKNPALTMAKSYREQFNRLLPEFGLSPSARTRLKAGDFGTDDGDGLFDF